MLKTVYPTRTNYLKSSKSGIIMIANRTLDVKSVANQSNITTILTGPASAICSLCDWHPATDKAAWGFLLPRRMPKVSRLTYSEIKHRNEMFVQGMLWCTRCKQFHPVKDFKKYDRSDRSNYGYRYYCLRCQKAQNLQRKEKQNQACNSRNAALKAQFVELAGGCCYRCGYDSFNAALDFHHVYPALKKYEPTYIIYSGNFEKAWRELDKCCLLCRNCHSTYKARVWQAEFIKRESLGYTIGAELSLDDNRYETDKPPKLQQAPLPLFAYQPKNLQLALFAEAA